MFHYFLTEFDPSNLLETQLSGISMNDEELSELLESIQKQEPQEYEQLPPPPQQSTFIEHYDPTNIYQSQPGILSRFRFFLSNLTLCVYSSEFATIVCSSW